MSRDLGQILGILIIILYFLTSLNYFVKLANRKLKNQIKKNKTISAWFSALMKFIVRNHRLFGMLTIVALLSHAFNQFHFYGISPTGAAAASVLLLQVGLGIYGARAKKRGKSWLRLHRSIAGLLFVAIGVHVVL